MANQKKLFAVMAADDAAKMSAKMHSMFPDAHLSVAEGQWLVILDNSATTTELSNKLRITDELGVAPSDYPAEYPGAALVLSVSNYYGRASGNVWEWITSKMGGTHGAAG